MVPLNQELIDSIIEGLAEKLGSNDGKLDVFCVHLDKALDARLATIEAQQARLIEFVSKLEELSENIPEMIEQLKSHPILGNFLGGLDL